MNIMTKRGSEDNIVTYEHYCDTKADLANIPQDQIALGSVAIVLKDEDDSMGIYLANSNKEWISFSTSGGGSSMSDISLANLVDVSLANPNDGDTLVYDATSEKWVAQAGGGSGGDSDNGIVYFHGQSTSNIIKDGDWTYQELENKYFNGEVRSAIFKWKATESGPTTDLEVYPNVAHDSDYGYIRFEKPFMAYSTNYINIKCKYIYVYSDGTISYDFKSAKVATTT